MSENELLLCTFVSFFSVLSIYKFFFLSSSVSFLICLLFCFCVFSLSSFLSFSLLNNFYIFGSNLFSNSPHPWIPFSLSSFYRVTCQKFESFIQNIICLPSVSLLMLRRCSELMYSVIYKHLLDRLAGQITLTALSHIYPLLLVS